MKIRYKNLRASGNDELPLFLFPVMEEAEKNFKGVSEEALGWSTAVSLACIGGVRLAEVRGLGSTPALYHHPQGWVHAGRRHRWNCFKHLPPPHPPP